MMKPIGNLITLDKAMEISFSHIREIEETENVHILEASGRVLAEDVISGINVPSFSRGTMDGYAVISSDTFGAGKFKPAKLKCIENIHAGEIPQLKVNQGECSQIATGAMVPEGADAVVKVENTEQEDNQILIYEPLYPWKNICPPGEDVKMGDKVLPRGDFLSPAKIGVLAALGMDYVKVLRRPLCVIVPTGNEVRPPGSNLDKGQIYDINSYTMDAILNLHGANTLIHPEIVEDELANIEDMFCKYKDADFLIFSGGSSVGERDIIVEAIKKHGEILFHGIAVKPGKPTLLGKIDKKLIFGMPGNPASCLSNVYIMLIPLIRKMAGLPDGMMKKIKLPLSRRINSELGRHQIMTVKIIDGKIEPVFKTSGAITSMSEADGYIEIPVFVDLMEKGEIAEAILF